jgi:hypothetical protein
LFIGGGGTNDESPPWPVGRPAMLGGGAGLLLAAGRAAPRGDIPDPIGGGGGWMSGADVVLSAGLTLCMPGSSSGRTVLVAEARWKDELPAGSLILEVGVPGMLPVG